MIPSQPPAAKAFRNSQGYSALRSFSSQYSAEKLRATAATSFLISSCCSVSAKSIVAPRAGDRRTLRDSTRSPPGAPDSAGRPERNGRRDHAEPLDAGSPDPIPRVDDLALGEPGAGLEVEGLVGPAAQRPAQRGLERRQPDLP